MNNNIQNAHEKAREQAEIYLQEIKNRLYPLQYLHNVDWSDVAEINRLNADLGKILEYLTDIDE